MTPTLIKKHIEENMVLSKDNLAFGYTYINETPMVICVNVEDCTEKIVFAVKENKELLWITTTLKNKDHKKAVKIAEENADYLIKEMDKWVSDEDSADLNVEEIIKVIDESLLVSDNIAFLLEDNERISIKAIHLDRRFYYAIFALSTNETLESNMDKEMLCRAKCAFKRNYKLLLKEVKERFNNGNTTDTTEEK